MAEDEKKESSARLTRERVLNAALARVQAQGIDFSIRDLASDLNVWPNAIYRHYKSRDLLIEAIVDIVISIVLSEEAVADLNDAQHSWQSRIEAFNLHVYDTFIQYPGVSRRVVHGALFTPNGLRLLETVSSFLVAQGISEIRAAGLFQVTGFFVAEMADLHYARLQGDSDLQGLLDRTEAHKDDYPIAYQFIHVMGDVDLRDRLRAGMAYGVVYHRD